ncbi:hypothetical protein SPI_02584 [Niveomyces insectorum RCEF 264]|uniref:Fungal specific transcription factor n=1 Tax=Niveomyces insectorum RCEF 264 TaxID=1081102 RepID=A0A167Y3U2_9HYPO|nr:hypothetical protein SPI_02584 [Niveomyces insectorum RCEF 264]
MASYIQPVLPSGVEVDAKAVEFFDNFYKTSDTPTAPEAYAESFTADATFILASKKCIGYDEILSTRHGMWASVTSRHHTVTKIFPFGVDSQEYMLYGTVEYTSKTGHKSGKDWAARAVLEKVSSGQLKFKFYQVYIDTAASSS